MKPCTKCTATTLISNVIPVISKYTCRTEVEEDGEREISSQTSEEIDGEERKTIDEEKKAIPKKKEPCKGIQIPLRKKFKSLKGNKCQLPFSRAWDKNESQNGFKNKVLPKLLKRQEKTPESPVCPREWDEYERKLWVPICKEPIKPPAEVAFIPIDQAVCVFCLGSLYTGGYLHDIYQKMPYIKKQSEENNDEITLRIGIRSRITVHKKCYKAYIDRSKPEIEIEEKEESDSDMLCDGTKKESEEEVIADLAVVKKQNFCLWKPKLPQLPSDLEEDLLKFRLKLCK